MTPAKCGLPDMSKHGNEPWYIDSSREAWVLGVMFAGFNEKTDEDDIVYIGINTHWEKQWLRFPDLPANFQWRMAVNTGMTDDKDFIESVEKMPLIPNRIEMEPRSVLIALGIKNHVN
jgi:glycogen operon protein